MLILIVSPLAITKLPRRMIGAAHESNAVTTKELPGRLVATHDTAGATVSMIVTVCVAVAVWWFASSPIHVTTLGPIANRAGELSLSATGPPSHTSAPTARPMRWSVHDASVTLNGGVTTGVGPA